MDSVAGVLRTSLRERTMALTPGERIALTAQLAEDDLDVFCAASGVPRREATRSLQRRRSAGRRSSCANEVGP
jgi:hypothetical protein